jgi:hypothetical protein
VDQPSDPTDRWLLLIHQLPPTPNYLRVKVGRQLARIGAVALKNTVYVLPNTESSLEDFQWVLREITSAHGDATLLNAQLVEGLSDREVEDLFRSARDTEYASLCEEARTLEQRGTVGDSESTARRQFEADLARLERRVDEIANIDFFGATGRMVALGLLSSLRSRLKPKEATAVEPQKSGSTEFERRTWVTRTGIHVDRIASAWLIRKFVDPHAMFKFVPAKGYVPQPGELRFDMFEAEFTHEGDLCTFEVLCARFDLNEPGLNTLSQLIHDIDVKDGKFSRPETPGLAAQLTGLTLVHSSDEARLAHGSELFDQLLAHFGQKRLNAV